MFLIFFFSFLLVKDFSKLYYFGDRRESEKASKEKDPFRLDEVSVKLLAERVWKLLTLLTRDELISPRKIMFVPLPRKWKTHLFAAVRHFHAERAIIFHLLFFVSRPLSFFLLRLFKPSRMKSKKLFSLREEKRTKDSSSYTTIFCSVLFPHKNCAIHNMNERSRG